MFMILKNGEPLMAKAADKDNQQHLEQNILKLTYKSFCQVVILGSSNYIPFMQLPTAGRRECVEDFLDIKVFSTMSVIAKERLRSLKDRHDDMEGEIGNLGYKCDLQQERIRELERQSDTNIQEIRLLIEERTKKVDGLEATIKRTQEHEKDVIKLAQHELRNNPQSKLKKLNELFAKMESKIDRIDKDSQFYKDHDECPTCQQHIGDDVKERIIGKNDEELVTLKDACGKLVEQQEDYEHVLKVATQRQKHVQSLQNSIFKYQTEVDLLTTGDWMKTE